MMLVSNTSIVLLLRLLWTIKYIIEQFSGNIFVLAELPKSCLIKFVDMFFSDLVSRVFYLFS